MSLFLGEDKITRVIMSVESADGGTNTNDATLSSGAQMLQGVTAYSKGTKYTGTIATVEGPTPDISVSSDGLIAASVSNPKGYQAGSTTKTATQQLTTKGATTITPSSANQIAVNSGVYTTGKITVSAVPTETKKITANGTYSPSAGKYFSSVEVAIAGDTPTYQSKTISPSTSVQTVTADSGYDALSDVTVNAIQTETKSVTSNGTYKPTSGKYFSSVTVNVPSKTFNTQTKTVTPTESTQTVSPDNGYNGLSSVTINPISSTYIGSAVPTKGATTITPNSNSQTAISSGTYATGEVKVAAVPSETKKITANGTYTPSNGKYFSSVEVAIVGDTPVYQDKTVNPTTSIQTVLPDEGYDALSQVMVNAISVEQKSATPKATAQDIMPSSGSYLTKVTIDAVPTETKSVTENGTYVPTSGKWFSSVSVNVPTGGGTPTLQEKSVSPTESAQEVVADAGYDGLSKVSVGAISADYIGSGITKKSAETYIPTKSTQTISAGQYLSGAQTIAAIPRTYVETLDATAVASDLNNGKTAYVNGVKVTGTQVIQKYYTSESMVDNSFGNDGDIFMLTGGTT